MNLYDIYERFRKRAKDLRACAELVGNLKQLPERVAPKDFEQVVDLMAGAASDIEMLVKSRPIGCICRCIEGENFDYFDYVEGCFHHSQLYQLRETLKADYAKMERALKNEARMKLVAAALAGAATLPNYTAHDYAKRAVEIADETIRRITETT